MGDDGMKKMRYVIVLFVLLIFACEKKTKSVAVKESDPIAAVQEQNPPETSPVLDIPFVEVLDDYFDTGNTSRFAECIGKVVTSEEMVKLRGKYSSGGYGFSFRRLRNDFTSGKAILYTVDGIRREDGLTDFKVLDITSLEGEIGYSLWADKLYNRMPQTPPNHISLVPNSNGVIEIKFREGVIPFGNDIPYDTPIIPKWIVTVNEEGKISITEPVDDSKFMYFSSEPE